MTRSTPAGSRRRRVSSSTSRRSTTASAYTPPWGICPRSSSSGRTTRTTLNLDSIFLGEDQLVAGPADVAQQQLQDAGGADDLHAGGVLRPPDRVHDGAGPFPARVGAAQLC